MEYKDIKKNDLKAYKALEQRVTDIFNGATGSGQTADEWEESAWATAEQIGNIMRAVDATFRDQFSTVMYDGWKLTLGSIEYFDQPRKATLFLFELGVRA